MNIDLWMGKVRESLRRVKSGSTFVVKDLFEGHEWNQLSPGDKRNFWKAFKNAVSSGKYAGVRFLGKRENNSSEYMKD